jgi:hypothetical protein
VDILEASLGGLCQRSTDGEGDDNIIVVVVVVGQGSAYMVSRGLLPCVMWRSTELSLSVAMFVDIL